MINVTGRIQWASCVEGSCLHNFITWFPWPLPNIVPSCNDFHDFNANVPKWVVELKGPNDWRRPDISDDFRVSTLHFPISRGWSLDQPAAKHFEEERSWNRKVQSIPARVCGMNMISMNFVSVPLQSFVCFPWWQAGKSRCCICKRSGEHPQGMVLLMVQCCMCKKNVGAGAECNLWPDKWQAKIW